MARRTARLRRAARRAPSTPAMVSTPTGSRARERLVEDAAAPVDARVRPRVAPAVDCPATAFVQLRVRLGEDVELLDERAPADARASCGGHTAKLTGNKRPDRRCASSGRGRETRAYSRCASGSQSSAAAPETEPGRRQRPAAPSRSAYVAGLAGAVRADEADDPRQPSTCGETPLRGADRARRTLSRLEMSNIPCRLPIERRDTP